jgi:hypothetical protein
LVTSQVLLVVDLGEIEVAAPPVLPTRAATAAVAAAVAPAVAVVAAVAAVAVVLAVQVQVQGVSTLGLVEAVVAVENKGALKMLEVVPHSVVEFDLASTVVTRLHHHHQARACQ